MAKADKGLEDLFEDGLKDVILPKRKSWARFQRWRRLLSRRTRLHSRSILSRLKRRSKRLEEIFALMDKSPKGKKCPAILGIIEEGTEIMKEYKGMSALDAGLVGAAQAVEHYEICRYGGLRTWAQELGLSKALRLLDATLREETMTDEALAKLATRVVNLQAA